MGAHCRGFGKKFSHLFIISEFKERGGLDDRTNRD